MKDEPAFPTERTTSESAGIGYVTEQCYGLTKRELIALILMIRIIDPLAAVKEADALLAELEKSGND